jgi:hypothetical protein
MWARRGEQWTLLEGVRLACVIDNSPRDGGEEVTFWSGFPRYQYAGAWGYETGGYPGQGAGGGGGGGEPDLGFGDEGHLLCLYGVNPNLPPITLQHVGFRWYDPALGRFIQRDPIGVISGVNVYVYVKDQPVTAVGPAGVGLVVFWHDDLGRFVDDWGEFIVMKGLSVAKKAAQTATGHSAPRVLGPATTVINCVKTIPYLTGR